METRRRHRHDSAFRLVSPDPCAWTPLTSHRCSHRSGSDETPPRPPRDRADSRSPPATTTITAPARREITALIHCGCSSRRFDGRPVRTDAQNTAEAGGLVEVTEVLSEFSIPGLTRPDFLDWPVRLRAIRETRIPT